MRTLFYALSFCFATMLIDACVQAPFSTPLRIDGSTQEAFQSSWARLRASLAPQQQSQLDFAVLPIALGKYSSVTDVPPSVLAGVGPQNIRAEVDGKTFTEILALANKQPMKIQVQR